jgi:hypothetical protein
MKKLLAAILAVVMCVALCACGTGDADVSENGGNGAMKPTQAPTVAPTMPMATEPVEDATAEPTQGTTQPEATTQPAACSHNFTEATCQKPATCTLCGETNGETAAHKFNKATCTVCGAENPTYSKIAKALKDMERYPKYISINKDLIATQYDLFKLNGDMKHFTDAHENTLQIQGYLKKVIEICEDYVNDDFWIKKIVEDCQECILEMPIVPTSTGTSAIRSYISKCKTYSTKADRIFVLYKNLCETYGVK